MPALRRKHGPMHDINVVPYIDVMLVLLVIFMVTAPLITPYVIDVPTVGKARAPRPGPGGAHARPQRPHGRRGERLARRPRQGAEERARRERGALGARGRRQERAPRVGPPGPGREAQAGNHEGWIAGQSRAMSTLAYPFGLPMNTLAYFMVCR